MGLVEKEMAESARAAKVPCRSIVRRRVSRSAYMRALETEGPHVATPEGEAWWREQERRHPFIMAGGNRPEGTDSLNGHTCRLGKVSRRFSVKTGWMRWEGGRWVRDDVNAEAGRRGEVSRER